ncbi:MAG: hypothetical protein RBU30_07050 [Polyangia bacterium]|jgi:hypothetical protein|nr:hypothetical protein [Polyangia bacterium]
MSFKVLEVHRRSEEELLNDEWLLLENPTDGHLSTRGCRVMVHKPKSPKGVEAAKLDPGFTVPPGGKLRLVCGRPGTKAHGQAPQDGVETYYLLMKVPLLRGPGGVVKIVKGQLVLAEAEYGA